MSAGARQRTRGAISGFFFVRTVVAFRHCEADDVALSHPAES
jgi:hypothetical protein